MRLVVNLFLPAGCLFLAACGEGGDRTANVAGDSDSGDAVTLVESGGAVLPAGRLVNPCDVLTEERAAKLVGAPVMGRGAGFACGYNATGGGGNVQLLLMPYPLEVVDSSSGSPEEIAGDLAGLEELPRELSYRGEIAGAPAFEADDAGNSVLVVPSGIRTGGKPPAEVLVAAALRSDAPHAERLELLSGLASDAVEALRSEAQ